MRRGWPASGDNLPRNRLGKASGSSHLGGRSLMARFGWPVRLRLAAFFFCVAVQSRLRQRPVTTLLIHGRGGRNRMACSRPPPRSLRFCRARLGGVKCVVAGAGLVLVGRRARTPVTTRDGSGSVAAKGRPAGRTVTSLLGRCRGARRSERRSGDGFGELGSHATARRRIHQFLCW
jgi:hypothetical protein